MTPSLDVRATKPRAGLGAPVDEGQAVVPALLAMGTVLIAVIAIFQIMVFWYGRGSVRAALDEGARAGARAGAGEAECEARANAAIDQLMGGPLGDGVSIDCTLSGDGTRMIASAQGTFEGWFGSVADYTFSVSASAAREDR